MGLEVTRLLMDIMMGMSSSDSVDILNLFSNKLIVGVDAHGSSSDSGLWIC